MPTIVSVDDSTVPGEGSSRLLLLVSSDNKHIVVEEDIMSRSRFISKQVEGFEATSQRHAILLPFSSFVLNKVIEYCSHYRGHYLLEDDPDAAPPGRSPVREWDQEFLDVDRNMLLRIIKAAHYLEIKSLVGSCARAIADMIRGKTTEEMREILGVENDFTPEEEAEAKEANAKWKAEVVESLPQQRDIPSQPEAETAHDVYKQFAIDSTFLTDQFRSELELILFDQRGSFVKNGHLETFLATSSLTKVDHNSIQSAIHRLRALVSFLESSEDTNVQKFIDIVRRDLPQSAWPQDVKQHFAIAWETLFMALDFPLWAVPRPKRFTDVREAFYPVNPSSRRTKKVEWTLDDLESAGLEARKTSFLHQHLQCEGSVVYIYALQDRTQVEFLTKYEHNKVAQKLGLGQLAAETIATIGSIVGKDPLYTKARSCGILPGEKAGMDTTMVKAGLSIFESKREKIEILSGRVAFISMLIRDRRRWWKVLWRDIQRQSAEQPMFFYGTLLAVFFGCMSVIQTVSSVWALVIAIQAAG